MGKTYRVATVAGSMAVAEEMLALVKEIFGDGVVGKPFLFSEEIREEEADMFLCFRSRMAELGQRIPTEKMIGIDMTPAPKFFVKVAAIPTGETRWVFCNSRRSAQAVINHCERNGLPTAEFDFVTFDDRSETELVEILGRARYVVGVSVLVDEDRLLRKKYGQYLRPDVEVIPLVRLLDPASVAAITQWVLSINTRLEEALRRKTEELSESLRQLTQEYEERNHIQQRLEYEIIHDGLTDCFNRRYFEKRMEEEYIHRKDTVAIVVVDLDGLKQINDNFGHAQGDFAIMESAKILKECFRPQDIVARIGGDEFAVLMEDVSKEEVYSCMRCVRREVRRSRASQTQFSMNLSMGHAVDEQHEFSNTHLLKIADERMYRNKRRSGRRMAKGKCSAD